MNKRVGWIVVAVLIGIFAVVGIAWAQTDRNRVPSSSVADSSNRATFSGGDYQLTDVILDDHQDSASPVRDVASGGDYRLQVVASPRLTGSGCCCLFLPCVIR